MNFSVFLIALALVSNTLAYYIYIKKIVQGKLKPHTLTYFVWTIIIGINLLLQLFEGVGFGTLLILTNFLGCLLVSVSGIFKYKTEYTKFDFICVILAIFAILLWILTKTPLYSVILSCIIDFLALLPSFKKSFSKPYDDSAIIFLVSGFEYLFSFPSYQVFSFLVLAYPVCVLSLDFLYSIFIFIRRRQLKSVV